MVSFDASRIVLARQSRGMTQGELAIKLGIAAQQLSKWELGEVSPSVDNACKIMNALQAPPAFFFVRSGSFVSQDGKATDQQ